MIYNIKQIDINPTRYSTEPSLNPIYAVFQNQYMKIGTKSLQQIGISGESYLTVFPGEIADSCPEDLSTTAIPSSTEA